MQTKHSMSQQHALNALFGKQAVLPGADGTYLIPHLRESCEELAAAGYAHNMQRCVTAGTPHSNGWYSVTALNHYIYEHADDTNMMLARVFINEGRPAMVASREQLLEDAPPGCNAFLMLAGRQDTSPHGHRARQTSNGTSWTAYHSAQAEECACCNHWTGNTFKVKRTAWYAATRT